MDEDDIRDYEDQRFVPPSSDDIVPPRSTVQLGPYARFLADMPDWIAMSQGEYTKAFDALGQLHAEEGGSHAV